MNFVSRLTALGLAIAATAATAQTTIKIEADSAGTSTAFFGANGGDYFDLTSIRELGLNSYRLFMGMERGETSDDDGRYGYPTIDDLKGALGTNPARIGDYINFSSYDARLNVYGEFLRQLNTIPGMEPLVVIRNSANWGKVWVPNQSPNGPACTDSAGNRVTWKPFTQADWNEVWQYSLAMVYWINVRNGLQQPEGSRMRVDRWSAHNEPNQMPEQGWCGSIEEYLEFISVTRDAIDFAYKTYLGDRPRAVHGGALSARDYANWYRKMFRADTARGFQTSDFGVIDFHPYSGSWGNFDYTNSLNSIRGLMVEPGVDPSIKSYPLWMSEWGFLGASAWDSTKNVVQVLGANAVRMSSPGATNVFGHHLWRMFDSAEFGEGLVARPTTGLRRRPGYHAYRLLIEALKGAKPVQRLSLTNGDSALTSIVTKNATGEYWVVVVNGSESSSRNVSLNLSALGAAGRYDLFRFDDARKDASALVALASETWVAEAPVTIVVPKLSITRLKVKVASTTTTPPANRPPVAAWPSGIPTTGVAPFSTAFEVTASDPEGRLAKVELFRNGTLVETQLSSPYRFSLVNLAVGTHRFTARATDAEGLRADLPERVITVTSPAPTLTVSRLVLVNAGTDSPVRDLRDGDTIRRADYPQGFTVEAIDGGVRAGSIEFALNGAFLRQENAAPFAIAGDTVTNGKSDYRAWAIGAGTYRLKATAFAGSNRSGIRGGAIELTIRVE